MIHFQRLKYYKRYVKTFYFSNLGEECEFSGIVHESQGCISNNLAKHIGASSNLEELLKNANLWGINGGEGNTYAVFKNKVRPDINCKIHESGKLFNTFYLV